ncbi:Glycosyl transferases group 1 [uncultured archaeon]|nr:Glycosyl transferases group 1 [uncultured archaeon]
MSKVIMMRSECMDARLEKEAKTLLKNGYDVTQIGWDRGGTYSFTNPIDYPIEKLDLPVSPESLKVILFLPIWWGFVIYKLLSKEYDIIHASNFDTFLPALFVAKIRRKSIIYDIFDFYADFMGFPIFPRLMRVLFGRIDRFLMRYADAVIIADDSRIDQIGKNANKNIISIYNSPNDYKPNDISTIDNKSKKFKIFFGGGVYSDRNIDKVILAIKDIKDIELVIMGPCPTYFMEELQTISANSENIKLHLRYYPHIDIIKSALNSDLLFSLYDMRAIPNNKYASPNKLFEAMMLGKPILVSEGTSMANIVRQENNGLVVLCDDVLSIRNAVLAIKDDPQFGKKLGENGRKAYETKYSWEIMSSKLGKLYSEILAPIHSNDRS